MKLQVSNKMGLDRSCGTSKGTEAPKGIKSVMTTQGFKSSPVGVCRCEVNIALTLLPLLSQGTQVSQPATLTAWFCLPPRL